MAAVTRNNVEDAKQSAFSPRLKSRGTFAYSFTMRQQGANRKDG